MTINQPSLKCCPITHTTYTLFGKMSTGFVCEVVCTLCFIVTLFIVELIFKNADSLCVSI